MDIEEYYSGGFPEQLPGLRIKALDPAAFSLITGAVGAFIAAWAGAYVGFRRGKKERALDRSVTWHEEAIQSIAQYEEQLERLRAHAWNAVVVGPSTTQGQPTSEPTDLPKLVKAPAKLWTGLQDTEGRARAALRLGDLYARGRTKVDCSVALSSSVNMVASHWMDVSPEPLIPWLEIQNKEMAAANVRRSIQGSLTLVLELDGMLARLLGPRYRTWRALRELKRIKAEITHGIS